MNNQLLERFKEYVNVTQFNAFRIGLASPEKIRSLSYGEVKKIETINYRTLKPEKDGLFCARIFGPVKDWECNCGKYKRMKHRGVTCEKCGVEVIQSRVRRERMGHIELVAPVCHIWYLKGIPSYLGLILDMSIKDLERVIYFDSSIVIHRGNSPFPRKTLVSSAEAEQYQENHPEDMFFKVGSGAQAVKEILANINLQEEVNYLKEDYKKTNSVATRHKLIRRIRVFNNLAQANLRPEWMIFDILPVLPPDLRPLVPLPGGRFASSDLNELYRRVLNRNIRLRRLIEIEAPEVIIRNEKRMLQEAVDALIDNGRRGQPVRGSNKRPLKSLSEMLRGKQGRFRQNLLGKRVDYSGRSVIVVDPELKMDQCGLPKRMALELFKSYVYAGLLKREMAANLRVAKKMVEDSVPEVWDVLEEVVKERPVLLNRAPTLHRLGIQAFHAILIEGKAITIHPLVCAAFNADFDGDQMAVHIPLSSKACRESENLVLSTHNVLSPSNGNPVTVPSQDMILGLHYMTKVRCNVSGEGIVFANVSEVITAFQCGRASLHARIKVRLANGSLVSTTVGRVILYEALPVGSDFEWVNKILQKNDLKKMIETIYYKFGAEATVKCLDKIKKLGFFYSTQSGSSCGLIDMVSPQQKDAIVRTAEKEVSKFEKLYREGVITNGERKNKVISTWFRATADIANEMLKGFEAQDKDAYLNEKGGQKRFNPVYMFLASGAKGSKDQIKQLVGIRGLMSTPSGDVIETPVKTNFTQGLSVFEYFISTHGARKGLADTALRTADSGYLTRRLVDVSQDVIIREEDCGTDRSLPIAIAEEINGKLTKLEHVETAVYSRTLAEDVVVNGTTVATADTDLGDVVIDALIAAGVHEVRVRSVLTCDAKIGSCAACYGRSLAAGKRVDVGEAVGIIAAQSIGEPGTQLTMRTFHTGGVDTGGDITHGLPRIVELFEARTPKGVAPISEAAGRIKIEDTDKLRKIVVIPDDGTEEIAYPVSKRQRLIVGEGDHVIVGQKLVVGAIDPKQVLRILGPREVQKHLVQEVQEVYRSQGVSIHDKHIEVIVRQMLKRVTVIESGEANLLPGELVDRAIFETENRRVVAAGGTPASGRPELMGITKASLATESWLSAASFQETTRVLTDAALGAKSDPLLGLKENVIIGKLIPAGTGLPRYRNIKVEPTEEAKAAVYSMATYDDYDYNAFGTGSGEAVRLDEFEFRG